MASSELSILLTARGNLQSELQGARDRVKDLSAEIKRINAAGGTVGDDLANEFRTATQAADKLSRQLKDTNADIKRTAMESSSSANKIGKAWKKAASIFQNDLVAGVSAASLALAGRQAINAYASAEKMQVQLNLAYSKFPALANASRDSFDQLNAALMNTTGADDDLLASAEATLARFQLTGTEIQALIPLVNDYAVATGTDLVASSETIGKALMGNARALKALGINFKTTGDSSQDLALIMQLLEEKVGGAGEAFGKTTAGQLAIAQANFENLQEEIGAALVPALEALVSIVKPIAEAFSGLSGPVKQVAVGVTGLGLAALIATPRIIQLKASMAQAGIAGGSLKTGLRGAASFMLGPWGVAMAAGTVALGYFMDQTAQADARISLFKDSIDATTGALNQAGVAKVAEQLATDISAEDWQILERYGYGLETVTAAIIGGEDSWRSFNDSVNVTRNGLGFMDGDRGLLSTVQNNAHGLRSEIDQGKSAFDAAGKAAKVAGIDIGGMGDEADDAADKVSGLDSALSKLGRRANIQKAMAAYRKSIKTAISKPSKEAAYDAIDSFDAVYSSLEGNERGQARFVQNNYKGMVDAIEKSGMSKKMQNQLLGPLQEAKAEADKVLGALKLIGSQPVNVTYTSTGLPSYAQPGWVNPVRKAVGGLVTGPGSATSDSIPALLSNGEYVIRAAAARRLGLGTLNQLNRADKMTDPGLAARLADREAMAAPLVGSMQVTVNNPSKEIDVEKAVMRGMARAARIQSERGHG